MNKLTIPAALISFVAAFLFVTMIKYQYDDPAWSRFQTEDPPVMSARGPDAGPARIAPGAECQATENALRQRIESARYCTADSDCTLFDFGYPIDCMTSVTKAEITALRLEYGKYEGSCDYRVYYDCPTEPMVRRAVCEQNRCTVTLHTNEALEETTRDFLGIESR